MPAAEQASPYDKKDEVAKKGGSYEVRMVW